MRLFIAVNFDAETKNRLLAIQDKIKRQAVRGNFSRPENLHLTVVFIGETDAGTVPAIAAILKDAVSAQPGPGGCPPFSLTLNRTGCFRHSGKELWWIGAGDGSLTGGAVGGDGTADAGLQTLTELRRRITGSLEAAGISFDNRPFRAHITLGREIKPAGSIVLPEESITVPVTQISLMKSEHIKGVLTYTEISQNGLT